MKMRFLVTEDFQAWGVDFRKGSALPEDHGLDADYIQTRIVNGFLKLVPEDSPEVAEATASSAPEELDLDGMTKQELATYAQKTYNVELDLRKTVAVLVEEVKALAAPSGSES